MRSDQTRGRVEVGGVEFERVNTVRRVFKAGFVVIERTLTGGRVVAAACEAEERTITFSGIFVEIASVRCWVYASSRQRKPKPCQRERDEKETAPQWRSAD